MTRAVCVWLNYTVDVPTIEEGLEQLQTDYVETRFNRLAQTIPELAPFSLGEGPNDEEWLEVDGQALIEDRYFDDITADEVREALGEEEEETA